MPTTLNGLLREAQLMNQSGADQGEVIDFIYHVAERYGIRVRHDQHDPHFALRPETTATGTPTETTATTTTTATATATTTATATATATTTTTPALSTSAAEGAQRRASPKPKSENLELPPKGEGAARRGRQRVVPAPVVRLTDGSHQLALNRIFDPDVIEDQAAPVRGATVGRLVLSGDKRGGGGARGKGVPLYYECNGLVLDARSWRALAVPPSAFNPRPSAKAVDPLLADGLYDVIRVDDGTVVTLYSWHHPADGDVWALASSNGYDVSSLCWIGSLTYAEVFFDLALRIYPTFGLETGMMLNRANGETRLDFARLDRTRCYTVGFRHHNFHPMRADPERMWQIQCADLAGPTPHVTYGASKTRGLPVIPEQAICLDLDALALGAAQAVHKAHIALDDSLAAMRLLTSDSGLPTLTLAGLRAMGDDAIGRAAEYIARAARGALPRSSAAGPALPPEIHYGYILRSRDPARTRESSDLLVETPLLALIRKIVYERAPRAVRDELTADDRLEYNAMRAYLTANERQGFLALYPDWTSRFQAFDEFVTNIIHLVIHALRQRAMLPVSREPALKSPTGQVARALLDHICHHENLTGFPKDTESIVRDYVVNPEYAFLFLRAMRSAAAAAEASKGGIVFAAAAEPSPRGGAPK